MSKHVGPIIFADPTARSQLLDEGQAVTFRQTQRTTGETHARWERLGKAQADVRVEEIAVVEPTKESLRPYREASGFETVEKWIDAIGELNGGVPQQGHLYRATLLGIR